MENNHKRDMPAELFTMSEQNTEFWIPPKSKEEYISDLTSSINAQEKIKIIEMLIEIYRLDGIKKGGRYIEEGRDELIELMKKCLRGFSMKDSIARLALREGGYCEKMGDYLSALKFYEASLLYRVDDLKLHYFQLNNYGFCLNSLERFADAEKILREAVGLIPQQYNAWKNLGVSLEHQGQYEEAAGCYLKAVLCSNKEPRLVAHLERLVERYPSLIQIPTIAQWYA